MAVHEHFGGPLTGRPPGVAQSRLTAHSPTMFRQPTIAEMREDLAAKRLKLEDWRHERVNLSLCGLHRLKREIAEDAQYLQDLGESVRCRT